jgi:hypothetical protein
MQTNYTHGYSALLSGKVFPFNGSRIGGLLRFPSQRRFDRNEKYVPRRPKTRSPTWFPGRNDIVLARLRPRDDDRIAV